MLSLKNITKSFGGAKVLQGVSFEVPVGKVTALIGPNGAGKTTLFDVISGFVKQDRGTVATRTNGGEQNVVPLQEGGQRRIDITNLETYQRARLGISRTFQQVRLCENLTIEDHFRMVEDNRDEKLLINVIPGFDSESKNKKKKEKDRHRERSVNERGDLIQTRGMRLLRPDAASGLAMTGKVEDEEKYKDFLSKIDLNKPLETRVLDLSYGQRKLLDFGLAVYRKHSILLLDEPVAGVNQVIRKRIHTILQDLKKKGETILLIEHDIDFVRAIADEVIVLDEGKVLTIGKPDQVLSEKRVLEAYLGE